MRRAVRPGLVRIVVLALLATVLSGSLLPFSALALPSAEFPVFSDRGQPAARKQTQPAFSGDIVVWEDFRGAFQDDAGNWHGINIRGARLDLTSNPPTVVRRFRIPAGPAGSNQRNPAIFNDLVVWQDDRNGNWDIFGARLGLASPPMVTVGLPFAIASAAGSQTSPDVGSDFVVWQDYREGQWEIFGARVTGAPPIIAEFRLTNELHIQRSPAVSVNNSGQLTVVWEDNRNLQWDIFGARWTAVGPLPAPGGEFPVVVGGFLKGAPDVFGDVAVWQDYRNGTADIFGAELFGMPPVVTEFPVAVSAAQKTTPSIFEESVAFSRFGATGASWDISVANLNTGVIRSVVANLYDQTAPSVGPGDVVVWADSRGTGDIWGRRFR